MIDIKNYIKNKEAGLVSISKVGSGLVLSQKQFDVATGEEKDPLVAGFHLKDVEKLKEGLEKTINDFDVLIEDSKTL